MNKKIIFLGPVPPPYMGPTMATKVLLDSKLKEEFDLIHLDTSDHRDLTFLAKFDFTNVVLGIKSYFQLLFLLIFRWPKIVYIPISQTTIGYLRDSIYIILSKLFFRKVVCHLRGGNFQNWLRGASKATNWYVKLVHKLVDAQIVLGESIRTIFDNVIDPSKIHIVPNGKDILACTEEKDLDIIRVLYLGNLKRTKGVLDVLHATKLIYQDHKKVEFNFVGAWSDEDAEVDIKAFISENPGIPINMLGVKTGKEKEEILCRSNLFIFPTYYPNEGHPWVIVEAMASGLPIISTRHAAIPDTIEDGVNGYFVEKKSAKDIYVKVMQIVRDPKLHKQMCDNSVELYQQRFTEEIMVEKMSRVFRAVLKMNKQEAK